MVFDVDKFISQYVTNRNDSMLVSDIRDNYNELYKKINEKSLLVIGGAGSIGKSFIKAVLPFKPKSLVVVDINENGLTELTRDLRSTKGMFVPEDYTTYPIDFSSSVFEKMFRKRNGFNIVANFAAHKHVRSEKDIYSIEALIRNNVLNLKKLLDLLSVYTPEEYFCVSTDKAANPVNIMGASKRIMEDMIFSYSEKFPVKTARFANVAFSNGSLPAGFLERMQKLQPISAPLDVKRYFVSPEESGQICMLSAILGKNREIFFPKLNFENMMSFDVIATKLLEKCGYNVMKCDSDSEAIEKSDELKKGSKNYPVIYTSSDTSGEKMFEEFYTNSEKIDMDRFTALGVIINKKIPDINNLNYLCDNLNLAFNNENTNKEDIINILEGYISNFQHIETGKSLDNKM